MNAPEPASESSPRRMQFTSASAPTSPKSHQGEIRKMNTMESLIDDGYSSIQANPVVGPPGNPDVPGPEGFSRHLNSTTTVEQIADIPSPPLGNSAIDNLQPFDQGMGQSSASQNTTISSSISLPSIKDLLGSLPTATKANDQDDRNHKFRPPKQFPFTPQRALINLLHHSYSGDMNTGRLGTSSEMNGVYRVPPPPHAYDRPPMRQHFAPQYHPHTVPINYPFTRPRVGRPPASHYAPNGFQSYQTPPNNSYYTYSTDSFHLSSRPSPYRPSSLPSHENQWSRAPSMSGMMTPEEMAEKEAEYTLASTMVKMRTGASNVTSAPETPFHDKVLQVPSGKMDSPLGVPEAAKTPQSHVDGKDETSADGAGKDDQPRRCTNCNTKETPSWRRCGPNAIILCNACGLYFNEHNRHRPFRVGADGRTKALRIAKADRDRPRRHRAADQIRPPNDGYLLPSCRSCRIALRSRPAAVGRGANGEDLFYCEYCAMYITNGS